MSEHRPVRAQSNNKLSNSNYANNNNGADDYIHDPSAALLYLIFNFSVQRQFLMIEEKTWKGDRKTQ